MSPRVLSVSRQSCYRGLEGSLDLASCYPGFMSVEASSSRVTLPEKSFQPPLLANRQCSACGFSWPWAIFNTDSRHINHHLLDNVCVRCQSPELEGWRWDKLRHEMRKAAKYQRKAMRMKRAPPDNAPPSLIDAARQTLKKGNQSPGGGNFENTKRLFDRMHKSKESTSGNKQAYVDVRSAPSQPPDDRGQSRKTSDLVWRDPTMLPQDRRKKRGRPPKQRPLSSVAPVQAQADPPALPSPITPSAAPPVTATGFQNGSSFPPLPLEYRYDIPQDPGVTVVMPPALRVLPEPARAMFWLRMHYAATLRSISTPQIHIYHAYRAAFPPPTATDRTPTTPQIHGADLIRLIPKVFPSCRLNAAGYVVEGLELRKTVEPAMASAILLQTSQYAAAENQKSLSQILRGQPHQQQRQQQQLQVQQPIQPAQAVPPIQYSGVAAQPMHPQQQILNISQAPAQGIPATAQVSEQTYRPYTSTVPHALYHSQAAQASGPRQPSVSVVSTQPEPVAPRPAKRIRLEAAPFPLLQDAKTSAEARSRPNTPTSSAAAFNPPPPSAPIMQMASASTPLQQGTLAPGVTSQATSVLSSSTSQRAPFPPSSVRDPSVVMTSRDQQGPLTPILTARPTMAAPSASQQYSSTPITASHRSEVSPLSTPSRKRVIDLSRPRSVPASDRPRVAAVQPQPQAAAPQSQDQTSGLDSGATISTLSATAASPVPSHMPTTGGFQPPPAMASFPRQSIAVGSFSNKPQAAAEGSGQWFESQGSLQATELDSEDEVGAALGA
ncbi:hypothetical protein BD324DRAFT_611064, partial [Kockovaella imperatae]